MFDTMSKTLCEVRVMGRFVHINELVNNIPQLQVGLNIS